MGMIWNTLCARHSNTCLFGLYGSDVDLVPTCLSFVQYCSGHVTCSTPLQNIPGYITDKIFNVLRGGAIPIYWGDTPTVERLVNPSAFINVKVI